MKKATIFFICIIVLSFSTNAQISISHRAEKAENEETIPPFDSTKNFLGDKNVKSYIGQVLYVNGKNEGLQDFGYDYFKREKEPDLFSKNDRYGESSVSSPYNTKYEDLFGKYFIVKDVLPDSRQKSSSVYEDKWWFKLENQKDPSDIAWFVYDSRFEHTFPFIVMSYYNYLQTTIKGKRFISSYREDDNKLSTCVYEYDFLTGEPIIQSPDDIWTAENVTIEDKYYNLVIIVKNQKGETSAINTIYYNHDGCINGKMCVFTEEKYNALVKKYGKSNMEKARKGIITVGMPKECVILAWGNPDKINRSSHGSDQWVYKNQYVYIENGKVTAWN